MGDIKITGKLRLQLIHEDGSEELFEATNLLTTQGKGHIASRMMPAPTVGPQSYVAVGTNGQPPVLTDTGLGNEIARVLGSTPTVAGAVWTINATFPPGVGTGALAEAGVYDTGNPGATTNLCRSAFGLINKGAGDTLNISWQVTIG